MKMDGPCFQGDVHMLMSSFSLFDSLHLPVNKHVLCVCVCVESEMKHSGDDRQAELHQGL